MSKNRVFISVVVAFCMAIAGINLPSILGRAAQADNIYLKDGSNVIPSQTEVLATQIDEENVDLITLDIASPEKMVNPGYHALKPGGFLYSYSPCVEQVARFCLAAKDMGMEVKTIECIVREYQVTKQGTRPKSRMLGHTGYMSFARKV